MDEWMDGWMDVRLYVCMCAVCVCMYVCMYEKSPFTIQALSLSLLCFVSLLVSSHT